MDFNKFFQSRTLKITLGTIVVIIIFLLVFDLGVMVGLRKANFSYKWGENYHRNFAGPRGGFLKDFGRGGRDFIGAHGVFGQIIKIDGSTVIIKGRDNLEKIVVIKEDTAIMRFRETIKSSDLKVDDFIVVIGEPNDAGQIEAKFIRVVPPSTGDLLEPLPPRPHV